MNDNGRAAETVRNSTLSKNGHDSRLFFEKIKFRISNEQDLIGEAKKLNSDEKRTLAFDIEMSYNIHRDSLLLDIFFSSKCQAII